MMHQTAGRHPGTVVNIIGRNLLVRNPCGGALGCWVELVCGIEKYNTHIFTKNITQVA